MARYFNYQNKADVKQSFRDWFFSDEFEKKYSKSSVGISIPIFDDILDFSSKSSDSWERRKQLMMEKTWTVDDHFFTRLWQVNPDASMAGEFNKALSDCNEKVCSNAGKAILVRKIMVSDNSVTIPFDFVSEIGAPPVIADIEYDKSLFALNEKKWVNQPVKRTNTIVLRLKKPKETWQRSFFGVGFKNVDGFSFFIDGPVTSGFVGCKKDPQTFVTVSCPPYSEPVFANEGNHYDWLSKSPANKKIDDLLFSGTSPTGSLYEAFYTKEPGGNESTQLIQITLPTLNDGRKYVNFSLVPQGRKNEQGEALIKTYVEYYDNNAVNPNITSANKVVLRVYNRGEWARFSIAGQICTYSPAPPVESVLDVTFEANNTAIVDLPQPAVSGILIVQKNGITYRVDLLDPSKSTSNLPGDEAARHSEAAKHFTVKQPAAGQHLYTVTYKP